MSTTYLSKMNGYILRKAQVDDIEKYYSNYTPLDEEVIRFTGCKRNFSKNEIDSFLKNYIYSTDKYLFFIISPDNTIIGETVINEINSTHRHGNFRVAIFQKKYRNKGIGTWAIKQTCNFSFNTIQLHRLSLEVFSFNSRAQAAYIKCGFQQEGILREAIQLENKYEDIIIMSLLAHEWKNLEELRHQV